MIAIITEKPSVGKEIARILGADRHNPGYIEGNGYLVTWAYGHLISLAPTTEYLKERFSPQNLPVMPDPFTFIVRRKKTEKGFETDAAAAKQIAVIRKVFDRSNSIIVATDAGREGELIFRYLYNFIGCRKPFKRLWISSLTDSAIRVGFENLKDGSEYDNLFYAADSRAKADWLVGINASAALCSTTGIGNNSLGRVQTPTLAMVCTRFLEHYRFKSKPYWQMMITVAKNGALCRFTGVETYDDESLAKSAYKELQKFLQAEITKSETKTVYQNPPLLYDLTALQKDASTQHDFSSEHTLEIAQKLYEKKLISYPRTGSRYIPDDVFAEIPALLASVATPSHLSDYASRLSSAKLNANCVNAKKVTDHHALLITGVFPVGLETDEQIIYDMIAGRMVESFSPRCVKESRTVSARCGEMIFESKASTIIEKGWRGVFDREEDREQDEAENAAPVFAEGEMVGIEGCNLAGKKTMPKPLYTEAALLGAMENAGRELTDQQSRRAIQDCGIGTPATRAAIISTLFARDYIERSGRSIIPTEKGQHIYEAVRNMRIADAELTASWEKALLKIEKDGAFRHTFAETIAIFTRQVTEEILSLRLPQGSAGGYECPKCKTGRIAVRHKVAKCNNAECGLIVYRSIAEKTLTDTHLCQLFTEGKTKLIKGFVGKNGKSFDAHVIFDSEFKVTFEFPPPQKKKGLKIKPR